MDARTDWPNGTQERRVESFYSRGAGSFGDCHGGYLNFGLWDEGIHDYVSAAENLVKRLGAWGRLDSASRLLDVGCGFGAQDVLLARTFSPARITGLDVTWPHVLAARERAAEGRVAASVHFEHGSATDLRFAQGAFTHVLSIEGVVHFDTRERFLLQAHGVLEPGGTLLLADYCLARPPRALLDRLFLQLARRGWKVPRENVDTVESYREKILRAGFADVQVERAGGRTIPQYFREQRTPVHLKAMLRIRGPAATAGGLAIDFCAWAAWATGALEYVLVKATKAAS